MSKNISEKILFKGQWLSLVEIEYQNQQKDHLTWECIRRSKRSLSVVIVARMVPSERIVLIRQYRPAIGGYIVGFPAGLVHSSAEESALRELKEETGYHGVIEEISPPLNSHAGVIHDVGQVVYVAVDESDPRNASPVQELEPSEDITVHLVAKNDIRDFVKRQADLGDSISPGLWYVFGLGARVWAAENK